MGAALMELKEGLREAELVRVAPGAAFEQRSSVVLLSGTLALTGSAADVPGMASCNTLEQVQPPEVNMCAARLHPLVVLGMLGLLCGGRLQQSKHLRAATICLALKTCVAMKLTVPLIGWHQIF